MGFDWEYILGAEGEDLQAAYEDHCADCWNDDWGCGWDDDWEDGLSETDEPSLVPRNLLGTCAAGEIVLASSATFQAHRLRLYRELAFNGQTMNYLVAAGNVPLLGILLTDDRSASYSENERCGIPLLWLPREHMKQGRPQEAVSRLAALLDRQRQPFAPLQSRIDPISVKLHARMAGLRIIQQENGHLWGPTSYGRSLGIIDGYLPPDEEGRYCHTLFILAPCRDGLDEALAFAQARETPFRPRLPWAQTLQRATQGLPRSNGYAAGIVQALASMPLTEYMASSPRELEALRGEFPLDDDATYYEAAWHVFRVCVDSDGSQAQNQRCMDLIFALTQPMFAMLNTMQRPEG